MSRPLPFTQASVLRAIKALEKAGKRVIGVRPDGTVLVDNGTDDVPLAPHGSQNAEPSKWEDVQA